VKAAGGRKSRSKSKWNLGDLITYKGWDIPANKANVLFMEETQTGTKPERFVLKKATRMESRKTKNTANRRQTATIEAGKTAFRV
jgi:hypothetical protein